MHCLSEEKLSAISRIVREVEKLSDIEKLYLYLQLPCGRVEVPEGELSITMSILFASPITLLTLALMLIILQPNETPIYRLEI